MAKNLKLNVKNTQLAEALKLTRPKKPSAKKKVTEERVAPLEATSPKAEENLPPMAAPAQPMPPAAAMPEAPSEKSAPAPVEKPAPAERREAAPAEPTPPAHEERAPETPTEREPTRPAPTGRPSYAPPHSRPQSGGYQGGYQGTRPREGYSSGPRPQGGYQGTRPQGSYTPGARPQGGYPPRAPGGYGTGAPRYQAPGSRPPYPPRTPGTGGYGGPRPGGSRPPGAGGPYGGPRPMGPPRDDFKRSIPAKDESGLIKKKPEDAERKPVRDFRDQKTPKRGQQDTRVFDARDRQGLRADLEDQAWRKRRPAHKMRPIQQEEIIRPKTLKVRVPITVKDLASEMKLKASQLIANLFMKGVVLTLNDVLDDETTIQLLGHDFECEITIDTTEEERLRITDKTIKQEVQETPLDELIIRPPVVAFMGHVDHGKTSLIDAIRKTNLAAGEAGAITQHIGAFRCHTDAGDITILDTPGHEAFSAMRERGADVTDIVVLVIAGDEGIRTQTIEALQQARTAKVPIIVALNKADKPNFNADNIYRQLAEHELLPESWGGQTITVNCSAVTGAGIKELVEMLALQAEILELRSNPNTRARGTVIESEMHKGLGPVATVLIQNGTLRLGDCIVFAQHYARVKTMHDEHERELTFAGPSTPAKITGLSGLPGAGSEFIAVKSEKEAKDLAEKRSEGKRSQHFQQSKRVSMESLMQEQAKTMPKKTLNLILRGDVQGSVEALKTSLMKIASQKVELNIIAAGVGEVSESDVQLANASKAVILGFHTKVERHAENLIKMLKVNVKLHDIIYHAVDDIREVMRLLLDRIPQENDVGAALVKATFKASQLGVIAGCSVTDGLIKRSNHVRLIRQGTQVWKGPISSLKRVKEDVREVSKGMECGIVLQNFSDILVDDVIQAFEITYLEQEL